MEAETTVRATEPTLDCVAAYKALRKAASETSIEQVDLISWLLVYNRIGFHAKLSDKEIEKHFAEDAKKAPMRKTHAYRGGIKKAVDAIVAQGFDRKLISDISPYENGHSSPYEVAYNAAELDNAIEHHWAGIVGYLKTHHELQEIMVWNSTSDRIDKYDEGHWQTDETASIVSLLRRKLLRELQDRMEVLQELSARAPEPKDKRFKNQFQSLADKYKAIIAQIESPKGMNTLIEQIAMTESMVVSEGQFDADAYKINLLNGVYDLKENAFSGFPKHIDRLCRNQVQANYRRNADCQQFKAFLKRIFADDESIKFAQKYFGVGLSGEMLELCLILYGSGCNGKSTLVNAVSRILQNYATSFSIAALIGDGNSRGANAEYEARKLKGVRMAFAAEAKQGGSLDEAVLKRITSKDPVCGRYPFERPISFLPTHKTVLLTNHLPKVAASDKGTWRRIALVKMEYDFDGDANKMKDSEVVAMFDAERDGILNWLLEGWKAYQTEGLNIPAKISGDSEEFRMDNDKLLALLKERFEFDSLSKMLLKDAWMVFNANGNDCAITSDRGFSKELKQRGFTVCQGGASHATYVHGLKPKASDKPS